MQHINGAVYKDERRGYGSARGVRLVSVDEHREPEVSSCARCGRVVRDAYHDRPWSKAWDEKTKGVSFYLVLRFGLMPPQMYPMHSRCEVAALVVVCPSLNSLLAHREGGERVWRIGMPDISIRFF